MIPRSRKGFELAVGTLVVMILGVLIVGGGSLLVWRLVDESTAAGAKLTGGTQAELRSILNEGKLVAVAPASIEVDAGDTGVVGVAVQNRLDTDTTFTLAVSGRDAQQQPLVLSQPNSASADPNAWNVLYFTILEQVPSGTHLEAAISVQPPKNAPAGTYTFLVKVMQEQNDEIYDSARLFTVRVP